MNKPTTVLPTALGTYLFCGSRDGRVDTRHMAARSSEVVRIRRDGAGKLMYIGKEIFFRPEDSVGAWLLITEEEAALVEMAQEAMLDAVARTEVPEAFGDEWWSDRQSRRCVVEHLSRPFKDEATLASAEKVFDRALKLGIIEPHPDHAGEFRLRKEEA